MKNRRIVFKTILFCVLSLVSPVQARETIVINITGEDIAWVVNAFNASQEQYEVEIQTVQFENWFKAENILKRDQKMAPQSHNKIADIIFIDNNWLSDMPRKGWLAKITDATLKDIPFVNGLIDPAVYQGEVYALPFSNKGNILFFRTDLHHKYGLRPPRDLDELVDNAKKIMRAENMPHGLVIHYSAIHLDVLPFVWSNGGDIVRQMQPNLTSPETLLVFEKLQTLVKEGILPDKETFMYLKQSYRNALKLFQEGRTPYLITWNNRIDPLENSDLKGKFDVQAIPPFKKGQKSYSVIGSWYFAINAYSRQKKGAIAFLNYFYADATQKSMALRSKSYLPVNQKTYLEASVKTANPFLGSLESALSHMKHRLLHPKETEISMVLQNSTYRMLIQLEDVKKSLSLASERIEQNL